MSQAYWAPFVDATEHEIEMADDDDDDEGNELGGVVLSDTPDLQRSDAPYRPIDYEMMSTFHQAANAHSTDTPTSWQLPVTPLNHPPAKLGALGVTHPVAQNYHKLCNLILRHWGHSPTKCLPPEVRQHSAYSFMMLVQLKRLATRTKNYLSIAQRLLIEARQKRVTKWQADRPHHDVLVDTDTSKLPGGSAQHAEIRVREDARGLMLEDVLRAYQAANAAFCGKTDMIGSEAVGDDFVMSKDGARNREAVAKQKIIRETRRAARRQKAEPKKRSNALRSNKWHRQGAMRDEMIRSNPQLSQEDELVDVQVFGDATMSGGESRDPFKQQDDFADVQTFGDAKMMSGGGRVRAPPNSPMLSQPQIKIEPPDNDDVFQLSNAATDHPSGTMQSDEPSRMVSQQYKHEYNQLSHRMNAMNIQSGSAVHQSDFSSLLPESKSIQAEQMNFTSLPVLRSMVTSNDEDMTRLGQIRLPGQAEFQAALPLKEMVERKKQGRVVGR